MCADFQIKPHEKSISSQNIRDFPPNLLAQFGKMDVQEVKKVYELFKSKVNKGEANLTTRKEVNFPSYSPKEIRVAKKTPLQHLDLSELSPCITSINSPLWSISQSSHHKQRAVKQEKNPLQSAMTKLFHELVLSKKITIENGKASCLYNDHKYVFDIPPEWNINKAQSMEETTELSGSSCGISDKYAEWEQIITKAIDQSPSAMLDKLSDSKREEVLRKEWLVDDPLTGICTGLAIQFLLDTELKGSVQTILPSDQARYWEKLLIPVMEKIMHLYYCDSPDELNQERHYKAIYEHMIKIIEKKAHLKASIQALHVPLCQLGEKLQSSEGHSLVCIELPGTPVAGNHTIYFNTFTRTIADNGVILNVPVDIDYSAFVDFYMQKMEYHTSADRFTLISVKKDPRFNTVRKPSMMDRVSLSTEMTFSFLLREMKVLNVSLADYDITPLYPYPIN